MPRHSRIVIPGIPHHITHKGLNGHQIFRFDIDRHKYLSILQKRCRLYGLEIHGYCLMDNHVHLVGTPDTALSLSKSTGSSHRQYSSYFTKIYGRAAGSLWQDRFFSCPLDDAHFIRALIYVDQNPVRAGIVRDPCEYQWSSARIHTGLCESDMLLDNKSWQVINGKYDYETIVQQELDGQIIADIRHHTSSGRPLGTF